MLATQKPEFPQPVSPHVQYPQDISTQGTPSTEVSELRDQAAARLVEEFCPRLYRYALVRLGRVDLAEEAVSEVLMRLVEKGPPLEGSTPHVHGWCVRCMVNVCREIVRRPRTTSLSASQAARSMKLEDYRQGIEDDAETRMLVLAVSNLSERQQEAVVLRVLMGLPVGAAARAMQCAEGTVKALTHQGIAALRLRLSSNEALTGESSA